MDKRPQWTENLPANSRERAAAMEKLVKGRDFAIQLQILLQKGYGGGSVSAADELVVQIQRSFTEIISLLQKISSTDHHLPCDIDQYSGEVSDHQIQTTTGPHLGSPSSVDRSSGYSGECGKRAALKDRRGCYKRRKSSESWITISATTEDGYAWRKYGQKEILNAKYPRCYYRCTHKNDVQIKCKAIKQVQKMEEDPTKYHTTYFGQHTCRDINAPPQINNDPSDLCLLSFDQSNSTTTPTTATQNGDQIPSVKEEAQSELSETLMDWPDLMPLESPAMKLGSDQEDVLSCSVYSCGSTGSHGFHDHDMDHLLMGTNNNVDLENGFLFW